jgi:hypothetical protein
LSLPPQTVETLAVKIADLEKLLDERYEVYKADQSRLSIELRESNARQNEWRQTLLDQTRTFVTMDLYSSKHEALSRQIEELSKIVSTHLGQGVGATSTWMMGVILLGLIVSIALHFTK